VISSSARPAALNQVSGSMPEYISANSGRNLASRTAVRPGSAPPTAPRLAGFMLLVLLFGENPDIRLLTLWAASRPRKRVPMTLVFLDAHPHRPL
jgi:hypothetical protein